jgi:alpha-amylase/alpha-mannosidase (GH57 family)
VSQDVLALIRKNGFEWTATDEGVLVNTIKDAEVKIGDVAIDPQHAKYFPWRAETPNGPITLFFRDHRLSDDIGFTYHSWNAKQAVEHFVGNLLHIRETLVKSYGEKILDDAVISVILDGENCWEYYPDNGFEFLDTLYSSLSVHKLIAPVTFSEALAIADAKRIPLLPRIVAGSWINANFRIWIGHPEDNAAWDAVAAAKDAYDRMQTRATTLHGNARKSALAQLELAHEELMVAEGSDWCWWFGDEHQNAQSNIFDELFRLHLRAMYVHLDLTVPANLMRPIISVGDDNVAIDPSSADLHKFSSMHRADG